MFGDIVSRLNIEAGVIPGLVDGLGLGYYQKILLLKNLNMIYQTIQNIEHIKADFKRRANG